MCISLGNPCVRRYDYPAVSDFLSQFAAGGVHNTTPDMCQEKRLGITLSCMAHRGIPGTPAVIRVIPGNGVVGAHNAAVVGRLVDGQENIDQAGRIGSEIVPLVRAYPGGREHGSRWRHDAPGPARAERQWPPG